VSPESLEFLNEILSVLSTKRSPVWARTLQLFTDTDATLHVAGMLKCYPRGRGPGRGPGCRRHFPTGDGAEEYGLDQNP
jgi:hypothetical protein